MKFRSLYDLGERVPGMMCTPGSGRTKQAFKKECDINSIMEKYHRTGRLPELIGSNPVYGDFSNVPTFQEALDTVHRAQAQFDALPAKLRQRFNNDPGEFLAFVEDPNNVEDLVKLGLAIPAEANLKRNASGKPAGDQGSVESPSGTGGAPGGVSGDGAGEAK